MRFVDRKEELAALNEAYLTRNSNLVVVYGRRRIGKTELIKRFGEAIDKKFVYYLCDTAPISEQTRRLAATVGIAIGDEELISMGAASIEAILYKVAKSKLSEKLVLVFDEFQNLARVDKSIPSIFQRAWDMYLNASKNVMLILSGSSISMMSSEVLSYSAPLYGRSTQIFALKPLNPEFATALAPKNMPFKEKLYLYFIFGGVPAYYAYLADTIKDYENARINVIVNEMLKEGSIFISEPGLLLSEEVRDDTRYMQILELIANGVNKPGEIASKLGIAHANLDKYISMLEYLDIVEKELPVTANEIRKSKKGVYRIRDNFIDFYFKELKRSIAEKNAERIINDLDFIAQLRFESFARELLTFMSRTGRVNITFTKIGRWWGVDPSKKREASQEEIDVVALNEKTKDILFGECKWSNSKIGKEVYYDLKRKAGFVQWHNDDRHEHFALFSKSGFTEEMKEIAKKEHVLLFDLEAIEKALSVSL